MRLKPFSPSRNLTMKSAAVCAARRNPERGRLWHAEPMVFGAFGLRSSRTRLCQTFHAGAFYALSQVPPQSADQVRS